MIDPYWLHDDGAAYATLLSIIETHCHPEAWDGAYAALRRRVTRDDPEMATFKRELTEAIADPSRLPADALFTAAEYDDGSDEAFLHRLWRDLYPDETDPGTPPA